jgi:hypothetical protein
MSPKSLFEPNKNAALDLFIFKDIIAKMTGLVIPSNLNEN